eukprot:PhF_6_TR15471/c0_g1_i2/m.24060
MNVLLFSVVLFCLGSMCSVFCCPDSLEIGGSDFLNSSMMCYRLAQSLSTTTCATVVVTLKMEQSMVVTEPCALRIPSNVTVQFLCNSIAYASYVCTPSLHSPCFSFRHGRSVEIINCNIQGRFLSAENVTNSTFALRDSYLDGKGVQMPLDLVGWQAVFMKNSTIVNGRNAHTSGGGGGCVAIRGRTSLVTFQDVLVENCFALRAGGCVSITGDDKDQIDEFEILPSTKYGGHVALETVSVSNCKSGMHRGGLMYVQFMTSIVLTNSRFSNGSAQTVGCLQIYGIASNITLNRNVVVNCNSFLYGTGGVFISQLGTHYPSEQTFITLVDLTISDCASYREDGCLVVSDLYGSVYIENLTLQRCTAHTDHGCFLLDESRSEAVLRNISLRDCLAVNGNGGGLTLRRTSVVNLSQLNILNSQANTTGGGLLL